MNGMSVEWGRVNVGTFKSSEGYYLRLTIPDYLIHQKGSIIEIPITTGDSLGAIETCIGPHLDLNLWPYKLEHSATHLHTWICYRFTKYVFQLLYNLNKIKYVI